MGNNWKGQVTDLLNSERLDNNLTGIGLTLLHCFDALGSSLQQTNQLILGIDQEKPKEGDTKRLYCLQCEKLHDFVFSVPVTSSASGDKAEASPPKPVWHCPVCGGRP